MAQVSPAFSINGGAVGAAVSVAAAAAVVATIDSIAGITSVIWSIASTDETSVPGDYVLVQSGIKGEIVSTTALSAGTSAILRATINNGVDPSTGNNSAAMTATGKFWVPAAANGFEVGAVNETFESNATFGSTGEINVAIRNAAPIAGVPDIRQVIAGAGMTGGGALSGDVTLNVAAADPSIVVSADSIAVGYGGDPADVTKATADEGISDLAARADHKHDIATAVAGTWHIGDSASEGSSTSLSRADHQHAVVAPPAPANVTKAAAATGTDERPARADHKHDITTANVSTIATSNSEGSASSLARSDHVHAHGSQTDGTLHALAIAAGAAGFMSGADKTKLDGITAGAAVASVSGTAPIVSSGGTTPAISISPASAIADGSMSSAHFIDVNTATDAATASKIVKRDGSGDASIRILSATSSVNIKDSSTDKLVIGPWSSGDAETPISSGDGSMAAFVTSLRFRNAHLALASRSEASAASIVFDGARGNIFDVGSLVDNVTFGAPIDFDTTGRPAIDVFVQQGAGAPWTIAWNAVFVFPTGIASAAIGNDAGEVDYYRFQWRDTYWLCTIHNMHVHP